MESILNDYRQEYEETYAKKLQERKKIIHIDLRGISTH